MKKIHSFILFFTGFFGLFLLSPALNLPYKNKPEINNPKPQVLGSSINVRGDFDYKPKNSIGLAFDQNTASRVKAKSFLVFNLKTGDVLSEFNAEQKLPIASLTKLMTGLVAYKNLNFLENSKVKPESFWSTAPNLGLKSNDIISVQNLFEAMLVGSANDAAFALAQIFKELKNQDFVEEMNNTAKSLGMNSTSFSNPAGYDSLNNYSTAEDLKLLVMEVFKLPAFRNLSRKSTIEFRSEEGKIFKVNATNKLISKYQDLLAVKTGFTKESLGSMVTVLEANGEEIGLIILDSPQREADTLIIREAFLNAN